MRYLHPLIVNSIVVAITVAGCSQAPAKAPRAAPAITVRKATPVTAADGRRMTTVQFRIKNTTGASVWFEGASPTYPYWSATDKIGGKWQARGPIHCGTGAQAFELKPGATTNFDAFLGPGVEAMIVGVDFAAVPFGENKITASSPPVTPVKTRRVAKPVRPTT